MSAPKATVYAAGRHLALDKAHRFKHPDHPAFLTTTRRVVVVEDDGRELLVRPVDEKTGEAIEGVGDARYALDRATTDFPIKGRWSEHHETKTCYSCDGSGRRCEWVPEPLRAPELAALSKLLEPWCPKSCVGRRNGAGWCYTHVPYQVGDAWERFDVIVCRACGHLRRNAGAVNLRAVYRAPLALAGAAAPAEEAAT